MQVEAAVYGHMGSLCSRYSGGFWEFYDLNNGGCYLAPNRGAYVLAAPKGFEATVSADVAGLIASLYKFSHLAFKTHTLLPRTGPFSPPGRRLSPSPMPR